MKILLINGSPKGQRSNSLRLASSFVDGLREAREDSGQETELDVIEVSKLNLNPCKGCFGCWKATPGTCVIKDDMASVIGKELAADLIVWSFPLYYFNVPGQLKNLIDRQLPMALPFMAERDDGYGSGSHPSRYDRSHTSHVIVSTCGFYSAEGNYDSVRSMFDHFLGKKNYTEILCGQGELFHIKEVSERTDAYLAVVRCAGSEYARGGITQKTNEKLHELLYPKEVFEAMADASWGVSKETGEKTPDDLVFTKQMAALYNKAAYDGADRVLEMNYTDLGHSYQILLGKDDSKVVTDGRLTTTTRINTPFEVWAKISRGEIKGAEALGRGMYTVEGDFELMERWDTFFGPTGGEAGGARTDDGAGPLKPPSMATMLIPWIAFWIAVSISSGVGAVITLAITALTPAFMTVVGKRRIVIWDLLSCVAVSALSLVAFFTGRSDVVTTVGYLVFGLMWLLSCTRREDLCATYVKYGYGGEAALDNPLFTRTTRILTMAWGALYVATAIWTYFLRQAGVGEVVVVANNIVPIGMGIFTKWFQKWYPAKLARG